MTNKSFDLRAKLKEMSHEELEANIYNDFYNRFCSDIDDSFIVKFFKDSGENTGKVIPYMGWFWRTSDFFNKSISIGKAISQDGSIWWDGNDGYVAVMENNKWGYPERYMSESEVDVFVGFIDELLDINNRGGTAFEEAKKKQQEDFKAKVQELNTWFASLKDVGTWSAGY